MRKKMIIKKVAYIVFVLLIASIGIVYGKRLEQHKKLNQDLISMLDQELPEEIISKINAGADINTVNAKGLTALMIATRNGDLNLLKWLLNSKQHTMLDLDIETQWDQPRAGKPALSFALERKNLDAVKLLVDAGANVNLYNDLGTTRDLQTIPESLRQRNNPLLIYAIGAKLPMPFIEALLNSKNLDVNKESLLYPVTALMIASAIGYKEAVKALLNAGADKEITNTLDNKRAINYARDERHTEIVKLLI